MLYLGDNPIAGLVKPIAARNVGEIVSSSLPLTDAGLHLLDGSIIQGGGIYQGFVDYIADLYDNTSVSGYKSNVTKIGSLTDNDGVLSGFSVSNYATINAPSSSINSFELVLKVKTASDITTYQAVLGQVQTNIHTPQINVPTDDSGIIRFSFPLGTNSWSNIDTSFSIQANTEYWLKMVYDGSNNLAYYSTDGQSYIQVGSVSNSNGIQWDEVASLGLDQQLHPFEGSIDLKESYININGERWWTGANAIKPCFCTESEWQNSVTTYGSCGKFVYDSVNNTVRLPKVTGKIDSTTDINALGDLEPLFVRLPNITGTALFNAAIADVSGALYVSRTDLKSENGSGGNYGDELAIDASRSSSVYSGNGSDTAIHEQAIKMFVYIVIANSTKTEIQVDIDEVTTDLNGKADVDFVNVNDTAKIAMAHNAMPSNTYTDLTLGASGTQYTAPADGWFYIDKSGNNGTYVGFVNFGINNTYKYATTIPIYNTNGVALLPVKKNDKITVNYNAAGTTNVFRFIYAQGSESEAQ